MQVLFGSQNKGKQKEISLLFADTPFEIAFPQDYPQLVTLDVIEDGESFVDNARKKARTFAEVSGLVAFSDDSGLCVDALSGFPGIISDRWYPGTAKEKNAALLAKLSSQENRSAFFYCVMVAFDPHAQTTLIAEGKLTGTLATEQRGSDGFGYDPIFIPDGYTQTLAELGLEMKNQLSARQAAVKKLKQLLLERYPQ